MKTRNPRDDKAYRARSRALKARTAREDLPCWLCGRPIDTDLPWKDPQAFTADHVEALATGGALLGELRPAHRACNSRRGARTPARRVPTPVTSRDW